MSGDPVWTVGRLLEWTTQYLQQKQIPSSRLEAQVLLAHTLQCRRIDLYTRFDEVVGDEGRQQFRELIRKRVEGCPVAYLTGHKEFFSLDFEVTSAVLIPRDDSVCLVDESLRIIKPAEMPMVLDLCTGSGCLAIAIAWKNKQAKVAATDISPEALAIASRNVGKHKVSERINLLQGDLFEAVPSQSRFDLIISNPPYIARDEIKTLDVTVRNYEPILALDGGPDGFAIIDRLILEGSRHLKPGGYLLIEIGSNQETETRRRFELHPEYELFPTLRDMADNPRGIKARLR